MNSQKEFMKIDNQKFYNVIVGKGETVVFIPGWLSIIDEMPFDKMFLKGEHQLLKEYQIKFLHLSNMYKSSYSEKPFMLHDYSNELKMYLDFLNLKKVSLIAHSAGGRFVIHFASMYPEYVNKIILISTAGLKSPSKNLDKKLSRVKFYFAKFFANDKQTELLRQTFTNLYTSDLTNEIRNIKNDTLILWGENDTEMSVRKAYIFNKLIPNSKLITYPDRGHMIIHNAKIYDDIYNFLKQ